MSKRMEFEHQIISDFLSRKMSRVQASELLEIQERTVSRKARLNKVFTCWIDSAKAKDHPDSKQSKKTIANFYKQARLL